MIHFTEVLKEFPISEQSLKAAKQTQLTGVQGLADRELRVLRILVGDLIFSQ